MKHIHTLFWAAFGLSIPALAYAYLDAVQRGVW